MKNKAIKDIVGGSVTGLLAVPEAMAFAVIIFSPLAVHQPSVLPLGIVSCVLTVAIANAIPVIFGGSRILISTPFSLTSVMMAALAAQIVVSVTPVNGPPDIELALVLMIAVVFTSGFIQAALGVFRLGDLTKYMPMPVIAGLRNGAAVAIMISQVKPLLGLSFHAGFIFSDILWPTTVVGIVSFVTMWLSPRLTKRIPRAVMAVLVGTTTYYIFRATGSGSQLTAVVGKIPSDMLSPQLIDDMWRLATSPQTLDLLLPLLPTAAGLAILNTLQTLVAVLTADNLTETRTHSNREIIGQGISNMACGMFGAMSAAGTITGTLTNYNSGGRRSISRLSAAALALAVILFLGPVIEQLPQIVLAGVLFALAFSMFDRPSIKLLFDVFHSRVRLADATKDLSVIATVMFIMLIMGPLSAVVAGVFVSLAHFVLRMSGNNVRREYRADKIRSYVHRNDEEYLALIELGKQIYVMELEGPLFFGTSDRLAKRIELISKQEAEFIILDFTHVSEIDTTAVNIICRVRKICRNNNSTLYLCGLESHPGIARFLKSTRLYEEFKTNDIHPSQEDGLAYAEDLLLDRTFGTDRYSRELAYDEIDCLRSIGKTHLEILKKYLTRQSFINDQTIFLQGETANAMYFILKGQGSVILHFDYAPPRKIGIVNPGAIFGEMAVLDGKPRSATVVATGELTCLKLSLEDLNRLGNEHPDTEHALMAAIGVELSKRIRISNRALRALRNPSKK